MNNYWVTFRIASDSTYQKRYDAMVKGAIEARGEGLGWAEPTSFWLLQSELGINAFVKKIAAGLDAKKDLLLVRELAANNSAYFGTPEQLGTLKVFLPDIKKVA
jgi:hypothetical protein